MKVVKFVEATGHLPVKKYWSSIIEAEGEYVSLADYQKLEVQYQELADNSTTSILSLVEQRKQLQTLLERWNEIAPKLDDFDIVEGQSPKLSRLIQDTSEVIK